MTAAAPFPGEGRRPLGEVLVGRGIVTREQLAAALEQQRSTGQHLGEIIVALGFAPGPIIAQALATQHGGLMKTEYGFATGWTRDDDRVPTPTPAATQVDASALAERDRTIAALRDWSEKAQAAIESRDAAIAQLRADVAAARAELEAESAPLASLQAQVEEQAAEIARMSDARTNADNELAERDNALEAARRELKDAQQARAELERRLQNARSRSETLARRVAEQEDELKAQRAQPAAEPNRWASAATHYVLRRGTGGYDLVACDGPPPAVGDTVDGLRVACVAPAGPGFEVPCVHLAE